MNMTGKQYTDNQKIVSGMVTMSITTVYTTKPFNLAVQNVGEFEIYFGEFISYQHQGCQLELPCNTYWCPL